MSLRNKIIFSLAMLTTVFTLQTSDYEPYEARLCITQPPLGENAQKHVDNSKQITQKWFDENDIPVQIGNSRCDINMYLLSSKEFNNFLLGKEFSQTEQISAARNYEEAENIRNSIKYSQRELVEELERKELPFTLSGLEITTRAGLDANIGALEGAGVAAVQVSDKITGHGIYVNLDSRFAFIYAGADNYEKNVKNFMARKFIHETLHSLGLIHPSHKILKNSYPSTQVTKCRYRNIMGSNNLIHKLFSPNDDNLYGKQLSIPQKNHLKKVFTRGTIENHNFQNNKWFRDPSVISKWKAYTAKEYECGGIIED